MNPLLNVVAPVGTRSGYGVFSRDVVTKIIDLDRYDVKILSAPWGNTPINALSASNPNDMKIIQRLLPGPQLPRQPEIHLQMSITPEFQPVGKFNIGATAGLEMTVIPPEWLDGINRMNLIVVTSEFVKNVFTGMKYNITPPGQPARELSATTPIEVIPISVDTNVFKPLPHKELSPEINDMMIGIKEKFCFLFVGHWLAGGVGNDRKNVGMLVKTFLETFKDVPSATRPALILKTSGATFSIMDREEILDKINAIKQSFGNVNLPSIYLVHGDLTDHEMSSLYNHPKVKAMVNFTRGEGFGIPLLEFSMVDKPIIASGWSGHLDFLNVEDSLLIGGNLDDVAQEAMWNGKKIDGAKWFTIDYKIASTAMRVVWKNYDRYTQKAAKLGKHNREKFSNQAVQQRWKEVLDKYVPQFSIQAPLNLPTLKKLG